jgi:Na+/proline symporter
LRFLKGSTILGATTGLVFAIMMVLIGKLGGFPVLPGATETAREAAGSGVVGGVGQQEVSGTEAFDATLATSHETLIAYMSTELAPFLAFGLAVVVGVLVATRLDEPRTNKLATAGAGMFAGGFLLVLVSSLIIGVLGPSVPDVLLESQGVGAAASAVDTSLASPQFSNILLNGVFAGVGSGATAAATVFSLDSFMLDE